MAKHLFVMDPMAALNRKLDSSLRQAAALDRRGDDCYHATPDDLAWDRDDGCASAMCRRLNLVGGAAEAKTGPDEKLLLKDFASIHMRKDPPFDMNYIETTWLLESAQRYARIYNHPVALRGINEKLAIFHFPEFTAPALVSNNVEELLTFAQEKAGGDAILKPLDLFGGRDIERIQTDDLGTAIATLKRMTGDGKVKRLIQPFNNGIFEGEVRVFTSFGEPIAWCLKRPKEGSFLANTAAGATLEDYQPTPQEEDAVRTIAESLMMEGVVFVGFDLIGGVVSEINITSPRLLLPPGASEEAYDQLAAQVIEDIARA